MGPATTQRGGARQCTEDRRACAFRDGASERGSQRQSGAHRRCLALQRAGDSVTWSWATMHRGQDATRPWCREREGEGSCGTQRMGLARGDDAEDGWGMEAATRRGWGGRIATTQRTAGGGSNGAQTIRVFRNKASVLPCHYRNRTHEPLSKQNPGTCTKIPFKQFGLTPVVDRTGLERASCFLLLDCLQQVIHMGTKNQNG